VSDRSYQNRFKADVRAHWQQGARAVIGVMPTGSGKSYTAGEIVSEHQGNVAVIAHRQELVGQLSLSIAKNGVKHQIIAPRKVAKHITREHLNELGRTFITPHSNVAVIGVDTLLRRADTYSAWLQSVSLWITDEAHHLLRRNKWGKAVELMPKAYGLGLTATPCRADGAGLGRHTDGVFDAMVEGPSMRDLIRSGFLTEYRVFAPPSDVNYEEVGVGSTGDYVQKQLVDAVRDSHLVGDVVEHYLRIASGKLGVTFAVDVATATDIARQFQARGVPAEVVSAKTPDAMRSEIIRRFRSRQLLQLVNVDLFGEGFDLPAIEVVSMARRTLSYSLYSQQFGRALRPMEGKREAIIIDHAGNVRIHGLPDAPRIWTLDRSKAPRAVDPEDDIPLKYCVACTQPFPRTSRACPYCGHYEPPAERTAPEHVDGDLYELDPATLAAMRQEVDRANEDPDRVMARMRAAGAPEVAWRSAGKRIGERQAAQAALRESMAWFAHVHRERERSETYRLFHHLFGTDVLSAQTLGRPEALELADRINNYLGRTVCPT
jgi:DNA repair protein RadD